MGWWPPRPWPPSQADRIESSCFRIESGLAALTKAINALLITKNDEAALNKAADDLNQETSVLKNAVKAAQQRR